MKKLVLFFVGFILVISGFYVWSRPATAPFAYDGQVTLYKSMSCGCCGAYASWLQRQGLVVNILNIEDMIGIKERYDIPASMRSCHTTTYGNYVVEGHIPIEAVKKLLDEKPNIRGIAMPGMPSGSPGMPGAKQGPFVIYALNNDESTTEFMRI